VNFFEHQDQAHRNTKRLVLYFFLATVLLMAAVVAVVVLVGMAAGPVQVRGELIVFAALATLALIGFGSLGKMVSLRSGGGSVARELGGIRVEAGDPDPAKRRLLNVVEEMAIASGVPVPEVYVLENEMAINAFAAGFAPGDAAVAVTRGTMERLTRDELQGVIAHEFSHIFNGDMRLNMRLIGVLHGILLIGLTGQILFRSMAYSRGLRFGRRREGGGVGVALLLMGLALTILGAIGVFFGRLIKAAVSRQREFLADASAVQFTRYPDGIAGALKKIGGYTEGSYLNAPRTEEVSHMLLGAGSRALTGLFATHPTIVDRIRAIDPSFDPKEFEKIRTSPSVTGPGSPGAGGRMAAETAMGFGGNRRRTVMLEPDAVADIVGNPGEVHVRYAGALLDRLPPSLRQAADAPRTAALLALALILGRDPDNRERQLAMVESTLGRSVRGVVENLGRQIADLGPSFRLPLLDVAFPALRRLPSAESDRLLGLIQRLASADGRIDVFEFVLARMLQTHLFDSLQPAGFGPRRQATLSTLLDDARTLLAAVAHVGRPVHGAEEAFASGMLRLGWATQAAPDPLDLLALDQALVRLDSLGSTDKRKLLEATVATVFHDGRVSLEEAEICRAVCDTLHIPLPPLEASLHTGSRGAEAPAQTQGA
jgi:Zn-dependent protease with chaperone function